MSKIFLTGMTAAHCSKEVNDRSLNFAGLMYQVLVSAGHDVTWGNPSVFMTKESLSDYDAVIVGVSPATSLSSNRIYGALSIIDDLWGDRKLSLFVDVPNVRQISTSFKSFSQSENTTKPFFSSRREYKLVVASKKILSRITSASHKITNEEWSNTTLYPTLPWKTLDLIRLPPNAKSNLVRINLDSHILVSEPIQNEESAPKWACDNPSSKWAVSLVPHLSLPIVPMRFDKKSNDEQVFTQISRSYGSLICPDPKDGTYWNYQYVQSMNAGVPIATQWQESASVSDAWGVLASNIDVMSSKQRDFLALAQRESYAKSIPSKDKSLHLLESSLGIRRK